MCHCLNSFEYILHEKFHVTNADGYIDQILLGIKDYSLHTRKECRFGQDLGQILGT